MSHSVGMTSPEFSNSSRARRRLGTVFLAAAALIASLLILPGGQAAVSQASGDQANPGSRLSAAPMVARPRGSKAFLGPNHSWTGPEAKPASPACSAHVCVHWTEIGADAPSPLDADTNGIPDQVDRTLAAADTSWTTIVDHLGFRAPLPDVRSADDGGSPKYDVYLADVGSDNLSGYTSSDDRRIAPGSTYRFRDVSAFTVVDNDFDGTQFPRGTALQNLQVTVAHELFHASEFAYDYNEDSWLVEGSATWAEDQVFDGANLNRRYLDNSVLANPLESVDYGKNGYEYGSWIFLQYLADRFGKDTIASIWRHADDSSHQLSGNRNQTYSMVAVRKALPSHGPSFSDVFAAFARDNLRPGQTYSEGADYPRPTPVSFVLDRHHPTTQWQGIPLDHLSSIPVRVVPGKDVRAKGTLKIGADGPPLRLDPEFRVTVRFSNGHHKDFAVHLNHGGNGSLKVPFGRKSVAGVDVTLVNASPTMHGCFKHNTAFSCSGHGVDRKIYQVRASLN